MEQTKKPVEQFYYSKKEWARLGCGPLPEARDRSKLVEKTVAGNDTDKGYN
jgi:hypothetical protein